MLNLIGEMKIISTKINTLAQFSASIFMDMGSKVSFIYFST